MIQRNLTGTWIPETFTYFGLAFKAYQRALDKVLNRAMGTSLVLPPSNRGGKLAISRVAFLPLNQKRFEGDPTNGFTMNGLTALSLTR